MELIQEVGILKTQALAMVRACEKIEKQLAPVKDSKVLSQEKLLKIRSKFRKSLTKTNQS